MNRTPSDEERRREDDEASATTRWKCCSTAGARNAQTCQRTTGSASASAAMRLTLIEVVNGSVTPSVTSFSSFGSGPVSQLDDPIVERERQHERGHDRDEADDQPRAELVEVLDERGLLTVVEAAWEPPAHAVVPSRRSGADGLGCCVSTACSSLELRSCDGSARRAGRRRELSRRRGSAPSTARPLPETASLNSRMPLPSDRPISGSRFAPKTSRSTTRMIRAPGIRQPKGTGAP